MRICFATNNTHKMEEVHGILGKNYPLVGLNDIGCHEELPEEKDTIEGNSLQKAEYVFLNYHVPCFADDTGLEVDALSNAPGVYSARYAGPQRSAEDNMALLLRNLKGFNHRSAKFKTVVTLVSPEGTRQFEGIIRGVILYEKRGTGGFGYDPLFLPDGYSKTLAEMEMEEKNKISHRARAVQQLAGFLKANPSRFSE